MNILFLSIVCSALFTATSTSCMDMPRSTSNISIDSESSWQFDGYDDEHIEANLAADGEQTSGNHINSKLLLLSLKHPNLNRAESYAVDNTSPAIEIEDIKHVKLQSPHNQSHESNLSGDSGISTCSSKSNNAQEDPENTAHVERKLQALRESVQSPLPSRIPTWQIHSSERQVSERPTFSASPIDRQGSPVAISPRYRHNTIENTNSPKQFNVLASLLTGVTNFGSTLLTILDEAIDEYSKE